MKFDVIIGNPPYNKGIIKRNHPVYNHVGMDFSREAHIGFYLYSLEKLTDNGILEFITPGRFLSGVNSYNTRKFLFENYNVKEITFYDCIDVFPKIIVHSIVVCKISKGKTNNIKVSYKNFSYNINPFEMHNLFIPMFDNKHLLNIYLKMCNKKMFFPTHIRRNVGNVEKQGDKYYKDQKTDIFCNKVLMELRKGSPEYQYTFMKSDKVNMWRCVAKEVSASYFSTVEPNIETMHTFYSIPCKNRQESDNIVKYTLTKVFKILKPYFDVSRNTSTWFSNLPMVNFDFDTEEDLYDYFDFNEEEKEFLTKEVI